MHPPPCRPSDKPAIAPVSCFVAPPTCVPASVATNSSEVHTNPDQMRLLSTDVFDEVPPSPAKAPLAIQAAVQGLGPRSCFCCL
jgi:hypothetical protein